MKPGGKAAGPVLHTAGGGFQRGSGAALKFGSIVANIFMETYMENGAADLEASSVNAATAMIFIFL